MLKMDLPNLEIVVRYYQSDSKRQAGNFWRLERFPVSKKSFTVYPEKESLQEKINGFIN